MYYYFRYKCIIEDKSTKAIFVDKKNKAWEQICSEFNSSTETGPRTAKQLKILYDNIKRETKKNVAEHFVRVVSKLHYNYHN